MKDFRIGIGYDVHRMAPERDLMLCTCHIPNETGLDGHSDADAPVHALIDAMFGALALGDIGQHYPDDDPQYLGASGETLLRKTLALPEFQGWRIGNLDITIIAQKPKLAPYVPQMREALAEILGVIRNAKAGARVMRIRRQETDMAHFPLEWAEFFVEYI